MRTNVNKITEVDFQSSNIKQASFNHKAKELTIEFVKGGTYVYYDVNEDVFNEFTYSKSQGISFNTLIKGNYNYAKLS